MKASTNPCHFQPGDTFTGHIHLRDFLVLDLNTLEATRDGKTIKVDGEGLTIHCPESLDFVLVDGNQYTELLAARQFMSKRWWKRILRKYAKATQ